MEIFKYIKKIPFAAAVGVSYHRLDKAIISGNFSRFTAEEKAEMDNKIHEISKGFSKLLRS
jgi:hypothetical protein